MVLALGARDQVGDIVIAKAPTQTHGPRLGAVRLGRRRFEQLIQSQAQGGIDHFLKGFAKFRGTFLRLGSDICVQRQSGSHVDIMMLSNCMSRHRPRVLPGSAERYRGHQFHGTVDWRYDSQDHCEKVTRWRAIGLIVC